MSKPEFIGAMHAVRASLDVALAEVDEEHANQKIDAVWSVKDLVVHVSAYDIAVLQAIEQVRRGEQPQWAWQQFADFDAWNAYQTSKRRAWSFEAVLAEFHESRARVLTAFGAWPDRDGPFGPGTWDLKESPVRWLTNHEEEHAEHLREALRLVRHA